MCIRDSDLLSYYIEDQPALNPDSLEEPKSIQDVKCGIIRVYLNYVDYCKELGVAFILSLIHISMA